MKKHRQIIQKNKEQEPERLTLKDSLNMEILQKLQQTKSNLIKTEEAEKVAEKERKLAEKKQREKNKSFEELLNETSLDWKKFK